MRKHRAAAAGAVATLVSWSAAAIAGETTTFVYDPLGRLVSGSYARTVGSVTTTIGAALDYDPAGNRKQYTVTGAAAAAPAGAPNFIVVGGDTSNENTTPAEIAEDSDYDPLDAEFLEPSAEPGGP